jgi:hypothetical protein
VIEGTELITFFDALKNIVNRDELPTHLKKTMIHVTATIFGKNLKEEQIDEVQGHSN